MGASAAGWITAAAVTTIAVAGVGYGSWYHGTSHAVRYHVSGPAGCEVRIYTRGLGWQRVTLPWERTMNERGIDRATLVIDREASRCEASCGIDVDGSMRISGSESCADLVGRFW